MISGLYDMTEDPALYEYTDKGLTILPGISWDEWVELWNTTTRLHRTAMFYIGDCLVFGESYFPDRHSQVLGDYAPETVRNAMWVCRRIEPHRRRPERLSFSLHQAVASLEPGEQDELLAQADAEGWRSIDMKAAVKARKKGENRYSNNGPPLEDEPTADEDDGELAGLSDGPGDAPDGMAPDAALCRGLDHSALPAIISEHQRSAAELRRCIESVRALAPALADGYAGCADAQALSHHLLAALGLPLPAFDRVPLSSTDEAFGLIPPAWRESIHIDGGVETGWLVKLHRGEGFYRRQAVGGSPHLPAAVCEAALRAAIFDIEHEHQSPIEGAAQ